MPAVKKTKTRRRGDAVKDEFRHTIIAAAKQLLSRDGFHAVSIRNITAEVGIGPMTFYRYFDSKQQVVQSIWEETFANLLNALNFAMAKHTGPKARLEAFLNAYLDHWTVHPDEAWAIFHGDRAPLSGMACEMNFLRNPVAEPVLDLWVQTISACLPKSAHRAERARLLRNAMFWQSMGMVCCAAFASNGDHRANHEKGALRQESIRALLVLTAPRRSI